MHRRVINMECKHVHAGNCVLIKRHPKSRSVRNVHVETGDRRGGQNYTLPLVRLCSQRGSRKGQEHVFVCTHRGKEMWRDVKSVLKGKAGGD